MSLIAKLVKSLAFALILALLPTFQIPMATASVCTQFKIGFQGPLTGAEAQTGIAQLSGATLALQKFLAANPSVSNISNQIKAIDDQGDPAVAANVVPTALQDNCLIGVVGPSYSGASRISLPLYEAKGIPTITPSAINSALQDYGPNVFNRLAVLPSELYTQMVTSLVDSQGNGRVAYFYSDTSYSSELAELSPKNLIVYPYGVNSSTHVANYQNKLTEFKALGATKVVLDSYLFFDDLAGAVQKAKSAGFDVVIGPNLSSAKAIDDLLPNSNFENVKIFSGSFRFEELNATLKAENANEWAPLTFDATYFMLSGIKSGSTTGSQLGTYLKTHTFNGISGELAFNSRGEKLPRIFPEFVVANGNVVVTNSNAAKLNGNLLSSSRVSSTDNFKFKVTTWDNKDIDYQALVFGNDFSHKVSAEAGIPKTLKLPNGSYSVEVYPFSDPQGIREQRQIYEVTVSNGIVSSFKNVSVTPNSSISTSGDTYALRLASKNTEVTINSDEDIYDGTLLITASNFGIKALTFQKTSSFNLDPSKVYQFTFYAPAESWKLAPTSFVSNVSLSGTTPYKVVLSPALSNIHASIDPMPNTGGKAQLLKDDGNGNFSLADARDISSSGKVGFKANSGAKVKVRFIPNDNQLGEVTTSEYTVPASGTLNMNSVAFTGQNVTGTVSLAGGGVMSNGYYEVVKTSVTPNTTMFEGSLSSSGQFAIKLPLGTYRVSAYPQEQTEFKEVEIQCEVTNINVATVCNGTAEKKRVIGTLSVNSNEPLSGYAIRAWNTSNQDTKGGYSRVSITGKFGLELEAGSYILAATMWKYEYVNNVDREYSYDKGYVLGCTYESTPKTCNVNLSNNFSYKILTSSNASLANNSVATFRYRASSSTSIESLKSSQPILRRFQANEIESVSLPDGEHLMTIEKGLQGSWSKLANKSHYLIKMSGGVVESVRNFDTDSLVTPINGTYDLALRTPNFTGNVLEGISPVTESEIRVTELANNNVEYLSTESGKSTIELQLPKGSYQLEVIPSVPSASRTTARFVVTVNPNGTISMTQFGSATLIPSVDGLFPLRFTTPNVVGKLTMGGSPRTGSIHWRKLIPGENHWSWDGYQNVKATGEIFGNFLPGKYRAQVEIYDANSDSYKTLIGPECVVPTNGVVTCDISVPSASINTTISANNSILKSNVYASVSTQASSGDPTFEVCCSYPNGTTGKMEFALLDGRYEIRFWQEKDGGSNSRTFKVEIKNQIITSFVDAITNSSISPVNGVYGLSFLPANLSGTIKNLQGTAIDFTNSGAHLSLERWMEDSYWGGEKSFWISNSSYEIRVDKPGKYRLYVAPQNVDTYSATYSSEFYVNSNSQVSTNSSSNFSNTLSNFDVALNTNNLLLKVLNPIDDKPLTNGYIHFYKLNQDGSREYKSGVGIWQSRNGLVGQYLPNGNYEFDLNVWGSSQLFSRKFTVEVTDTATVVVKSDGFTVSKDGIRHVVKPYTTNIKGRILDSNGNVYGSKANQYTYVNVQKYSSEASEWRYANYGTNVDVDGYFGLRVREIGKFRLIFEPQGSANVAQTVSSEFEITQSALDSFVKDFGDVKLNSPNFKIVVTNSDTGTALSNIYITMFKLSGDSDKNKQYVKGIKSDGSGIASGYINEEGRYEFDIYPPWDNSVEGATRKTYISTVTKDSNNNFVMNFDLVAGVTVVDGITRLRLGGSNLRGVVYRSDGTTPVSGAQVLPYRVTAEGELPEWDKAVWTSNSGKWSLNLPVGVYKLKAQAPYEAIDLASSPRTGLISVATNGVVTSYPVGKEPLNFGINLTVPNWSGVLKAPTGDELIKNSSFCLNYRVSGGNGRGECFRTDSQGRFGFSMPDDALFDSDTRLNFYDPSGIYPELRLKGKTQIESVLGASGTGITVRLPAANLLVTVTGAGQPQKGVWVSVERPGVEWVGGQQTNDQGVSGIYSSNLTDAFQIGIWVPTKASAINQEFVSTIKYYSATDITSAKTNGVFQSTVSLPVPNIKGAIRTPIRTGVQSELASGAYLNVLDVERGEWVPGISVSADGTFAMFLRGGCCESKTYQLFVDPGYDKDGKRQGFVRKEYTIEVSTSNVATIKDKRTNSVVGTETIQGVQLSTIYLGTPNLTGVVMNPSNQPIANSEVYAWGKCQDWWGCYQYSNQSGQFGLSLADGEFTLGARTPWGNSEFADSERCVISVSGDSITNKSGNCIQNDGKAKISLRDPNFTFTLKDGANPLRNAYIYFSIGGWGTQARTDNNGKVAILVNDQEIAANSQKYGTSTLTPYVSVWMWGNEGDVIPWSCAAGDNKPICNQLSTYAIGTPFGTKALGEIQGATFNTRIKVISPDNTKTVKNYAYVNIIRFDEGYDNWFGWGETNDSGYARFYLETSSALVNAKFKVRVVPPYEHRNSLVEKTWDNAGAGYTLAQLNNLELALGTPNLKLAVVAPNGSTPNRWGWYSLEIWDSQTATYNHVAGNGLDYSGLSAMNLLQSKKYRLVAYPGGGRSGSATTCIINSDSSTVITLVPNQCIGGSIAAGTLTLALARGNVVGTVLAPDGISPIVGAIVYANVVGANNEDKAVVTCTLSDGTYGMTLDPGQQWDIKVFPANKSTGPQYANKVDQPSISPQLNVTTTVNVTLSLKP